MKFPSSEVTLLVVIGAILALLIVPYFGKDRREILARPDMAVDTWDKKCLGRTGDAGRFLWWDGHVWDDFAYLRDYPLPWLRRYECKYHGPTRGWWFEETR